MRDLGLSVGSVGLCNKGKANGAEKPQEQLGSLMNEHMANPSASRCERRGDTLLIAANLGLSPSSHSPPRPFLGETPRASHQLGSQIIQMPSKKAGLCSQHMNSARSCHNLDFQGNQRPQRGWQRKLSSPHFLSC